MRRVLVLMTNQRRVLGILTNGGLVTEANVHNIVIYRTHDRAHEKESDLNLNLELDNNNLEKYYKTEYFSNAFLNLITRQ